MTPEPELLPRAQCCLHVVGGFDLQRQRSAQSWGQQGLVVTEATRWTAVASGGLRRQKPVPRKKSLALPPHGGRPPSAAQQRESWCALTGGNLFLVMLWQT